MLKRFLVTAMVALGVIGLTEIAQAANGFKGNFNVKCAFSHANYDDPIVYPGQPGAAHLHHFFGSRTTDAFSTASSMRSSATTCSFGGDTSGYWVPALVNRTGQVVQPYKVVAYYRGDERTKPFPKGLKMIAGGDTRNLSEAGYSCSGTDGNAHFSLPQDCGNREVEAVVTFLPCWDGQNKDSLNHRSHMSDPVGMNCPPSHPVKVPRLTLHVRYRINNGTGYSLSSGSAYTLHADFWNTWNQTALAQKVQECINPLKSCAL
jgi:hypothetical protein